MECITVLKNPERSAGENPFVHDTGASKKDSGESRFCSHNQTWIYLVFLVLFLAAFSSQVVMFLQMQDSKNDISDLKDNIKDLLDARIYLENVIKDLLETREIERLNKEKDCLIKKEKTSARKRRNNVQCEIPHFFLYGHNESNREESSASGVFYWQKKNVNEVAFTIIQDHSAGEPYLDGIQIVTAGTYEVFAKVHVRGRSDEIRANSRAVGLSLEVERRSRRNNNDAYVRETAFITQDNRGCGHHNHQRCPVDVLEVSGTFNLNTNDIIRVKKPRNEENNRNIFYDNREKYAHFGAHMIEPRGPCIT